MNAVIRKKKNGSYISSKPEEQYQKFLESELLGPAETLPDSGYNRGSLQPKESTLSVPKNDAVDYTTPQRNPNYSSDWQAKVDELLNQANNRPKFSFDLARDPSWKALADQAVVGGQRAMADTLAKASAMTGGQLSSYSQAVGQQAYQSYLQQLNAHIPGIVQAAEARYNREGDALRDKLNFAINMEREDYGRWQDAENKRIEQERREEEQRRYEEALKKDQDRWETEKEWHDQARQDALNRPSYSGGGSRGGGYSGGRGSSGRGGYENYDNVNYDQVNADTGGYVDPQEIADNQFYAENGYWPWETPGSNGGGYDDPWNDISIEGMYERMALAGASQAELDDYLQSEIYAGHINQMGTDIIRKKYYNDVRENRYI